MSRWPIVSMIVVFGMLAPRVHAYKVETHEVLLDVALRLMNDSDEYRDAAQFFDPVRSHLKKGERAPDEVVDAFLRTSDWAEIQVYIGQLLNPVSKKKPKEIIFSGRTNGSVWN